MTDTYPAGGSPRAPLPDGHLPTGDPAQDAWNRRHEALAQDIMAATGTNPSDARHQASNRMRAAGDFSPMDIARRHFKAKD